MRFFTLSLKSVRLSAVCFFCVLSASIDPTQAQDSWGSWGGASNSAFSSSTTPYAGAGGGGIGVSSTNTDWKLGVSGSSTDVGIYVQQVEPNSSAMRAGIGAGDTIICVANSQVGQIGNQVFDLEQAIRREADSYGRVRILFLSGASRQLRSLQVQLDKNAGGLSGTIAVQGNMLAPDSIVNVELENVTRPHFVVRNGSLSFRPSFSSQRDIPFVLNFDSRYISETDSFRVRATATSGGRVTHTTEQQPFVLTRGYPNTVVLTLVPISYGAVQLPTNITNINTVGYPSYNSSTDQLVTAAYQRYLGRTPSAVELAVWAKATNGQLQSSRDVDIEVMGSQEYFDRVGNNNIVWLQRVFVETLGRNPAPDESSQWLRRFGELRYSRTELLRQLKQVSGR